MPEVTLTPLIDTALTLLIIFMVTTPMINNAIKVNLPRGKAQECKNNKRELIVSLTKSGKLSLNNEKEYSSTQDLISALRKVVGNNKEKIVYLDADGDVKYELVTDLVGEIKEVGGIAHVALSTRKA